MSKLNETFMYFGGLVSPKHPTFGGIIIVVGLLLFYFVWVKYRRPLVHKIKKKNKKRIKPVY